VDTFIISSNTVDLFVEKLESHLAISNPTLCISYTDALFDFKAIATYLKSLNIDLLGTTTCGEICNDQVLEGTLTALFLDIDTKAYKIFTTNFGDNVFTASAKLSDFAATNYKNPGILVYASGIGTSGDAVVDGIKSNLPNKTPIYGGLAGDGLRLSKYTVFTNTIFEENGLVAVVFDNDRVEMKGKSLGGYNEIGKTHIANKTKNNIIYEIDNKPAYDLFEQYFGDQEYLILDKPKSENDDLEFIELAGTFPLKLIDDNKEAYLRSPLYLNQKDKSVILAGNLPEGSKFKFCSAPDLEVSERVVSYFNKFSKTLNDVDCVIINNCAGRSWSFGPIFNEEISQLYNIWKVPTAGFLAIGEIGNGGPTNECSFHNVTISLTTLKQIK